MPFITSNATNKGAQMKVNSSFPLVNSLNETLNVTQKAQLKTILRMVSTELNSIRRVHEDCVFIGIENDDEDEITTKDFLEIITDLISKGFEADFIKNHIVKQMGYRLDTLPPEIGNLLK